MKGTGRESIGLAGRNGSRREGGERAGMSHGPGKSGTDLGSRNGSRRNELARRTDASGTVLACRAGEVRCEVGCRCGRAWSDAHRPVAPIGLGLRCCGMSRRGGAQCPSPPQLTSPLWRQEPRPRRVPSYPGCRTSRSPGFGMRRGHAPRSAPASPPTSPPAAPSPPCPT